MDNMGKRDANEADLLQNEKNTKEKKSSKMDSSPNAKLVNVSLKLRKATSTMSQKMGEIYVAQTETVDALNYQGCFIESVSNKLSDLEKRDKGKEKFLSKELRSTKEQLANVNAKVEANTKELKSCNMKVNGIAENKDENCKEVAVKFFRNLVPNLKMKNSHCVQGW